MKPDRYEWTDRKWRLPRRWSNARLRELGPLCSGDTVNVSAWRDVDKEGGHYRDYFPRASSYTITNWLGERGIQGGEGEIELNLEAPLPAELEGAFDTVFNHTTLEHVFDVFLAFSNLCRMSRDAVIVVVPAFQEVHFNEGFSDYWRFTPFTMRRLFESNGMTLVYEAASPERENASIYLVAMGVRDPAKWTDRLPASSLPKGFLGEGIIRNDPFTQAATVAYRWLSRRKWYQRWAKRAEKRLKGRGDE